MRQLLIPTLLAFTLTLSAVEEVTFTQEGKQVIFQAGAREILRFQAEGERPRTDIPGKFLRGGYISTLLTPSGRRITDDYALNHPHHHGVWTSWTKTTFEGRHPDFWNMGDQTGKSDFATLGKIWKKDGKAGLTARNRFTDLTPQPAKVALDETIEITVSAAENAWIIDFTSTQTCATDTPLELLEYHYGGFGFRGNFAWNGKDKCQFLAASGETLTDKINTSRQPWCWVGGKLDGETCGITIMGHPSNFRAPQPVRAHPTEPFFCFAPPQLGAFKIEPGKPYVSRYRLIVADGPPDAKAANQWWEEYSKLP